MSTNTGSNVGSLGDLQRAFQDYLLASSESFQAAVRDTRKANRVTLLDVYRDGYALRLIEALTTDYPGLMAMAGPADFDHMARAYIAAHPSRHPSIRWYGKDVADFLSATPPYSRTPAAAEMARFEWALGDLAARAGLQFPLARRRRCRLARRAGRWPDLPRTVRSDRALHRRGAGAGPRRRPVTRLGRGRPDRGVQPLAFSAHAPKDPAARPLDGMVDIRDLKACEQLS